LDVEDDGVEGLDIVRRDEGDSFDVQRTAVGLFSVRFAVAHIAMAVAGRTKKLPFRITWDYIIYLDLQFLVPEVTHRSLAQV
jgi:hypothetical protein